MRIQDPTGTKAPLRLRFNSTLLSSPPLLATFAQLAEVKKRGLLGNPKLRRKRRRALASQRPSHTPNRLLPRQNPPADGLLERKCHGSGDPKRLVAANRDGKPAQGAANAARQPTSSVMMPPNPAESPCPVKVTPMSRPTAAARQASARWPEAPARQTSCPPQTQARKSQA